MISIQYSETFPVITHLNGTDHLAAYDIQVNASQSCSDDDQSQFALENRLISLYGIL
uniref:Uncharacterized protein n=1 Tax=Arion vulgaris TaxID=1028688 RepID=A0A0B7B6D0_9EUPU